MFILLQNQIKTTQMVHSWAVHGSIPWKMLWIFWADGQDFTHLLPLMGFQLKQISKAGFDYKYNTNNN